MEDVDMKRLMMVLVLAAAGLLMAACSSGKSPDPTTTPPTPVATAVNQATPTPIVTVTSATTTPIPEPTPTAVSERIEPCTDGSQDSCALWQDEFAGFSHAYPNASIGWLDCAAMFVSSSYTRDALQAVDSQVLSAAIAEACGLPE
jgi:hypothetical protein